MHHLAWARYTLPATSAVHIHLQQNLLLTHKPKPNGQQQPYTTEAHTAVRTLLPTPLLPLLLLLHLPLPLLGLVPVAVDDQDDLVCLPGQGLQFLGG
jgi:hypothetical protein